MNGTQSSLRQPFDSLHHPSIRFLSDAYLRRISTHIFQIFLAGIGAPEKIVDRFTFDDAKREAKLVRLAAACGTCFTISRCARGDSDSVVMGAYRRIAVAHERELSSFGPEIQRMFAVRRAPGDGRSKSNERDRIERARRARCATWDVQ